MHVEIWTDGGGNTGSPCSCACVINAGDKKVYERAKKLPDGTNNIAEFEGIFLGVQTAQLLGATSFTLHSDSDLCVQLLKGKYQGRNGNLDSIKIQIQEFCKTHFIMFEFVWIPREHNKRADKLCREIRNYIEPDYFFRLIKVERKRPKRPKKPSVPSAPPNLTVITPTGSDLQVEKFIENFRVRKNAN